MATRGCPVAATVRTVRQLAASGDAGDPLPSEVIRVFDFLNTAEQDLKFLMDMCAEHVAALEKQPIVLRRVDSVLEAAQNAFVQVEDVVEGGFEKIRRTRLRKRAQKKFVESAEFRSLDHIIARHNAAILRELVQLRHISLQSPTPSQATTTTTTTTVSEEDLQAWARDKSESLTKFDNIALLADLMGDVKLSNSTPSPPPKYRFPPTSRSTFPVAELSGSTGHRTDSVSSCPASELSAYGTGSTFEPAELPADHEFILPPSFPSELGSDRGSVYRTHRATVSCVTLSPTELSSDPYNSVNSTKVPPSELPERNTRPRSVSQGEPAPPPVPPKVPFDGIFDPHVDHAAQPFSPLSDLRPFVQPLPVVEEKQVVSPEDIQRYSGASTLSFYEEKEAVVRQSQRKKSNPRLLLNQADKAGLSLLMGDEPSYAGQQVGHKSSTISLISNAESQENETYFGANTEKTTPPPPFSGYVHTVRSEPSLATISTVSALSEASTVSTQLVSNTTSTSSKMAPVQPLSTIPPELLHGHAASFRAVVQRDYPIPRKPVQPRPPVPSIAVQEPTPVDQNSGLRDLFG